MKNVILFLLLLSVGFNIGLGYKMTRREGPPVAADERPGDGRRGGSRRGGDGPAFWKEMQDRRLDRMVARLDLTPEQAEAFRARHTAFAGAVMDQRQRVHAARTRLRGLIDAGAVEADSVRAAIREVSRRQSVLDSLVTETVLGEMELLDDSQRAAYLEFLPSGRGPGGGHGHGERRNRRGP